MRFMIRASKGGDGFVAACLTPAGTQHLRVHQTLVADDDACALAIVELIAANALLNDDPAITEVAGHGVDIAFCSDGAASLLVGVPGWAASVCSLFATTRYASATYRRATSAEEAELSDAMMEPPHREVNGDEVLASIIIKAPRGDFILSRHALRRYVERLPGDPPKYPWLSASRTLKSRLLDVQIGEEMRQINLAKYGKAVEAFKLPKAGFFWVVTKECEALGNTGYAARIVLTGFRRMSPERWRAYQDAMGGRDE